VYVAALRGNRRRSAVYEAAIGRDGGSWRPSGGVDRRSGGLERPENGEIRAFRPWKAKIFAIFGR